MHTIFFLLNLILLKIQQKLFKKQLIRALNGRPNPIHIFRKLKISECEKYQKNERNMI